LDTDNNSSTGNQIHGIGAELEWIFGQKNGIFTVGGNQVAVYQNDIGVVTSPTVTSDEFEIALERNACPDGQNLLFTSDSIQIVFKDNGTGDDRLPDASGGVQFIFDDTTSLPLLNHISIGNQGFGDIRILTYNVYTDNLFEASLIPSYTRIFQAVQPQIIGFQEIYHHNAQQTQSQVESMLPSREGQQWYSSKVDPDIVALSRYPILNSYPIEGQNASSFNGSFLIDLHPDFNSHLLFIVAHLPAGSNNWDRQYEIDAIMAFIRNAKEPGGVLTLLPDTPIIIVGDMNLVRDAQHLTTFLTGQIINTGQFGSSFKPDWDSSDFTDLFPRHVSLPMFYTWYKETNSYSPGRLDFMIYSDSVIDSVHSFVLFTPAMSTDSLTAYNLQIQDAILASDHLPVVADFVLTNPNKIETFQKNVPHQFKLYQNHPNPFNPITTISYQLKKSSFVKLSIYHINGKLVETLVNENKSPGYYSVEWNSEKVCSGIYFYKIDADEFSRVKKCLVVK
ncbi:MAG: T9SS type A sorting domain-containing protein, partial [Candidatus Marinimicrobia bacterium]|nr:T9SS type A sorting domain-containing protein [Candidatus Neomarinimicrobiota bacterium]